VVLTVVREAIEAVDPDPESAGRDTVADLVAAYVAFVEGRPDLARIYVQIAVGGAGSSDHIAGRVRRHHRRRLERFAAAMERAGFDPETAGRRGELLLAGLNGLALFTIVDPSHRFGVMADALLEEMAPAAQPAARRTSSR
jgi:hypothetical protein